MNKIAIIFIACLAVVLIIIIIAVVLILNSPLLNSI